MSDSSRSRIIYRPESTFGESAPANAATTLLRFSSASFGQKNTTVDGDEIRGDRQSSDVILTALDASGDIVQEPNYGGFIETVLEAVLGGSWGTPSTDVLRNGLTQRSFGFEEGFIDIGKYMYFPGCVPDKVTLDIVAKQPVKMTTAWQGQPAVTGSASIAGTTAVTAAPGEVSVLRAGPYISLGSTGAGHTELNGVSARSIKLEIANNLRRHDLATSFTTDNFGYGRMDITGQIETYFKDLVAYNAFIANAVVSLRFNVKDPLLSTNNAYQFTLPYMKLRDAPIAIPGVNQDIMMMLNFRALLDPAVGYTLNVERNVDL